MVHLVHRFGPFLTSDANVLYTARAYASPQRDGTWAGWLVFFPHDGSRALPTDRETTQPRLEDVAYWAGGLSSIYLEGALRRALALLPEAQLQRRANAAAQEEAIARAEAEAYARAAEHAKVIADVALEREESALEMLESIQKTEKKRARK